jgi:surfeit locus 1 family protein
MAGALWPYLDWHLLAERAGPMQEGVVLRQDAAAEGALLRIRPAMEEKRGMHIGYAVQWFAFAAIVALATMRLLRGARRPLEAQQR